MTITAQHTAYHGDAMTVASAMFSLPQSHIHASRGLSLNFGVCVLSCSIREVTSLSLVDSADAATNNAIDAAQKIVNDASRANILSIAPTSIDQFEGDLLIRWQYSPKTMMLICPAGPGSLPQLYREVADTGNSAKTHLLSGATDSDLVNGMVWLLSGTSDI